MSEPTVRAARRPRPEPSGGPRGRRRHLATAALVVAASSGAAVGATGAAGATTSPGGAGCAAPFSPVAYVQVAEGAPRLPPGIGGQAVPYPSAGASVEAALAGQVLNLTVSLDGVTRELTTAPHEQGGHYDRTPGPADTGYGEVHVVESPDGATYVVLVQDNSGRYTRIGWRFDDPCAGLPGVVGPEAGGAATVPAFTG